MQISEKIYLQIPSNYTLENTLDFESMSRLVYTKIKGDLFVKLLLK